MDNSLPTEFDLIVVGTGLVESIVSAAASRVGKKVLHVDNKSYYGGHWASFNLEDFQNLLNENTTLTEKHSTQEINEVLFHAFGNNLGQLQNFQSDWHIEDSKDEGSHKNDEDKDDNNVRIENVNDVAQEISKISEEAKKLKINEKEHSALTQESLKNDYRKFIIDLCPKLHFSRGNFVELLISSNIARYTEFKSVSRVLTWINGNLEVVPCSRSDVFANNKVSVVEKRMLMKLLTSIEEDEKNLMLPVETTYKSLLKSKKLSENIVHFVLYALSMSTDDTLWLEGLRSTKRFLHSLGRFGKTPFLFSMYGSGEFPQAFCRLSAVFGCIFALNQSLHGLITNSDNCFEALLCGEQRITAPYLVMNVGMVPQKFLEKSEAAFISRAVLITDRSLMASEMEHLTLLLFPLKTNKLCRIIELGTLTRTVPKNLFLVHLTAVGTSNPTEDFQECIDSLFTFEKETEVKHGKPRILWSSFFSIPDTNGQKFNDSLPENLIVCPGPDADLDYDSSVKKAKELFSSMYPDEEFLPRAPDEDEIVIEGEIETNPETEVSSATISGEVEEGIEQALEGSSYPEVAVEAKASSSELHTHPVDITSKEVEECSEVKEVIN